LKKEHNNGDKGVTVELNNDDESVIKVVRQGSRNCKTHARREREEREREMGGGNRSAE
jgi:hypothetical protein